jgi:hypothetical protein
MVRTVIVFAPAAILCAVITRNPWAPDRLNNVIVITIMLLAAPIPFEAPVTTATLPFSFAIAISF